MNKTHILMIIVTALAIGFLGGRLLDSDAANDAAGSATTDREIAYWVAPMDPGYRRDEPGKSPMGMDLVPVYTDDVDSEAGVVKIDPTVINNLGVRISAAERGLLPRRIETVGYVGYDEDTVQHVHTRVDGWIEKLETKSTGDPVKKGQLLFELYSPTLVNAQEEYLTAVRSGNKPLLNASRERLKALGVNNSEFARLERERSIRQRIRVFAESDGVIVHLGVREGIFVTPATEVMAIAELDKVWVTAEVFERQSAWVKAGQMAMVELDYLPGKVWHGMVDYVYPELDPKTRTLQVRLRFDNAATDLRPNMFARVTILGDSSDEVVHVPREAVIRGGAVDRVVVALGNGRFKSTPVQIGNESGDRVAIQQGLEAGTNIVVSAQFLIDSESNIDSALSRMSVDSEGPSDVSTHEMSDPVEEDETDNHSGMESTQ